MAMLKFRVSQKVLKELKYLKRIIKKNDHLPKEFRKDCKNVKRLAQSIIEREVKTWTWRYDAAARDKRVAKAKKLQKKQKMLAKIEKKGKK